MLRVRALRARERRGRHLRRPERPRPDLEGERPRDRARRVHDRRGTAPPRSRLGRDRRDPPPDEPARRAAEVPDGLLRRLEEPEEPELLALAPGRLRALRRPGAAVLRRRLQGARRDVLGAAGVAAEPADAGLRAVDGEAARCRAPRLALERRAAEARGLPALDVRALDPGDLRPAALPRPAGLRNADAVRDRARRVGAERLHRHVQLGLRPRLEARHRDRDASRQRRLLLLVRARRRRRAATRRRSRTGTASASGTGSRRSARA